MTVSSDSAVVVLLAILHQKAQGGGWVTPEGTCRMDPGDQERAGSPLEYSETTETAGAQKQKLLGDWK